MADDDPRPRAPSGALSLTRIVNETLALIDEQGIAIASMRSVGERLGVRAMSLYRYVGSREELFDHVVERVVDELASDPEVHLHPLDGWHDYLHRLAYGVRRFALAHPRAFPLVATRPPEAPWINPPLRSLRWVEAMLSGLRAEGFSDEQVLFTYRTFNGFLLGYLLLETSALVLRDPRPGDGSFQRGSERDGTDPVDPGDPVPAALSPARTSADRQALDHADVPDERIDPVGEVDANRFPMIRRLQSGLTQDYFAAEFAAGLEQLLGRIEEQAAQR